MHTKEMPPEIKARFAGVYQSRTFNRAVKTLKLADKRVLDIGCGYGEYMQRFGEGSVGITTTDQEVEFGAAHGIPIVKGNAERLRDISLEGSFETIWANNLFEHLVAPHAFLMRLRQFAGNDTTLVLGVPVIPLFYGLMRIKKFRGALASPHINFFTRQSLIHTVECAGWDVLEARSFAVPGKFLDTLTCQGMPHMYIVAKNNPDFVYPEKKRKEWIGDTEYHELLNIGGVSV